MLHPCHATTARRPISVFATMVLAAATAVVPACLPLGPVVGPADQGVATDSGDTAAGPCPEGKYSGPLEISYVRASCEDATTVLFEMRTVGIASMGLVFSQETGNVEPQYVDEHSLEVVERDDCGSFTMLERRLATGHAFQDIERDESTVFRCDESDGGDPYHHLADVMTYAFRAYDAEDSLGDCVIVGDDPAALQSGTFKRWDEPEAVAEIAECRIDTPGD